MKLTQRGKYVVVITYTIIMTLLLTMVWNKYDVDCVDKYTADILATQFLYGEGEDVDRAMTAIYNNISLFKKRRASVNKINKGYINKINISHIYKINFIY